MSTKSLDLDKKLLGQWNALVRRARIGRDYKAAALTMSSYANAEGGDIRLSVARYAVDLEVSYSTARRYLRWLQAVGLLEMTRAGNRRRGTASEYRLILSPDILETLDVLTPTRHKELADEMREAERDGSRGRAAKAKVSDQRSPGMSVEKRTEKAAQAEDYRSSERALMGPINAQMGSDQRSPWMTHTPSRTHLSVEDRPSRADDEDLGTAVTGPRASPAADQCPVHHIRLKPRTDGTEACAFCRREQRAGPPNPEPDPPPPPRPPRCEHGYAEDRCRTCLAEQDIAPVYDLTTRRTA